MDVLTHLTVSISLRLGSRHETVMPTLRADCPTSIKSSTKIPRRYTYRPTWSRQSFLVRPSRRDSRSCQTVNFGHRSSLLYVAENHITLSSNFLCLSQKLVLFIWKCEILFYYLGCFSLLLCVWICCLHVCLLTVCLHCSRRLEKGT